MPKETNPTSVVEREVEVDVVEKELRESGAKIPSIAPLTSDHKGPISRHQFIQAARTYKPKVVIVDLPAPFAGSQLKVRELTAGERDKYEGKLVRGRLGNQKLNMDELRIGLVIATVVDWEDEITPMFNDKDKPELAKMGISVIQPIYNAASELNAVSKEDEDEMAGE